MERLVLIITIFWCGILTGQNYNTYLRGSVPNRIEHGDSIYFSNPSYINKKFYKNLDLNSVVKDGNFNLDQDLDYPQLYSVQFKSTKGLIPGRGEFFLDRKTNIIELYNSFGIGECHKIIGETQHEYKFRFIPFLFDKQTNYDCMYNNVQLFRYMDGTNYDLRLQSYIEKYPSSYVALWLLIERFSSMGYSPVYERMVESFSEKMKGKELWQTLQNDLKAVRILSHQKFPAFDLKTEKLLSKQLQLPEAKYILVDFWFSHCRPCLEAFPDMKRLYQLYKPKGFEIIGISVDKTEFIDQWQQLIMAKELPWLQYLDENGKIAQREKIINFPTNFLLDEKGKVLQKNIPIKVLENLLEKKLRS